MHALRSLKLSPTSPAVASCIRIPSSTGAAAAAPRTLSTLRCECKCASQLPRANMSGPAGRRSAMLSRHFSANAPRQAASTSNISGEEETVKAGSNMGLRIMTLNRPKALNSLNSQMITLIKPLLEGWESSRQCSIVLLKGEGRAFCAGGDVVSIVEAAKNSETRDQAIAFFKQEYECDRFLAHMKKPVIAFLDGITMGGGVGLSVHAPFRIATEKTVVAMPETNIGLFPDVGANFFLPRLDGELGAYLGLTSERLTGYGVYQAGVATHFVPSDRLGALEERLGALQFSEDAPSTSQGGLQLINACIEEFVGDADALQASTYDLVGRKRKALDSCFGYKRAEEIVDALRAIESGKSQFAKDEQGNEDQAMMKWAKQTRETIEMRSPTSVKVALEGIRQGASMNINQVFDLDMHVASIFCNPDLAPDFVVGVTHLLKNKQKTRADWKPAQLSELSQPSMRSTFFDLSKSRGSSATLSSAPEGAKPYTSYPHAGFALPSEQLIGKVVKGDVKDSGSFALGRSEVFDWFEREWAGKIGVKEKVEEVLSRRTKEQQDGTLKWK